MKNNKFKNICNKNNNNKLNNNYNINQWNSILKNVMNKWNLIDSINYIKVVKETPNYAHWYIKNMIYEKKLKKIKKN